MSSLRLALKQSLQEAGGPGGGKKKQSRKNKMREKEGETNRLKMKKRRRSSIESGDGVGGDGSSSTPRKRGSHTDGENDDDEDGEEYSSDENEFSAGEEEEDDDDDDDDDEDDDDDDDEDDEEEDESETQRDDDDDDDQPRRSRPHPQHQQQQNAGSRSRSTTPTSHGLPHQQQQQRHNEDGGPSLSNPHDHTKQQQQQQQQQKQKKQQHSDSDDEEDSDYERRRQRRKLQKKLKHSAANKIQNQWKKAKGDGSNTGAGGGGSDDGDDQDDQDRRRAASKPKAVASAAAHASSQASRHSQNDRPTKDDDSHSHNDNDDLQRQRSDSNGNENDNGHDTSVGDGTNDNDNDDNSNTAAKKKKKGKTAKTVVPPVAEIIEWNRSMPIKRARKHVTTGLRVKVRFATKVKREGKIIRRKKWFGGRVAAASKEGSKIRIKYDDGTAEISKFPDKDVVVDDAVNGDHQANANKFLPPEIKVGAPDAMTSMDATMQEFATQEQQPSEDAEGDQEQGFPASPPRKEPIKLKSLVTDIQLPSPPMPQKETVARAHSLPSAPHAGATTGPPSLPSPGEIAATPVEQQHDNNNNNVKNNDPKSIPKDVSMESSRDKEQPPREEARTTPIITGKVVMEPVPETAMPPSPPIEQEPGMNEKVEPVSLPLPVDETTTNNGNKTNEKSDEGEDGLVVQASQSTIEDKIMKDAGEEGKVVDMVVEKETAVAPEEPPPSKTSLTIRIPNLMSKERRDASSTPKSPKLRVHLSLPGASKEDKSVAEKPKAPLETEVSEDNKAAEEQLRDINSDDTKAAHAVESKKRRAKDVELGEAGEESESAAPPSKRIHIQKPVVQSEEAVSSKPVETTVTEKGPSPSPRLTLKLHVKRPSSQQESVNVKHSIKVPAPSEDTGAGDGNEGPVKIAGRVPANHPNIFSDEEDEDVNDEPKVFEKQQTEASDIPKSDAVSKNEAEQPQTQRPLPTKPTVSEPLVVEAPADANDAFQKDKVLVASGNSAFERKMSISESEKKDSSLVKPELQQASVRIGKGSDSRPSTPREKTQSNVRVGRKAAQEANERLVTTKPDKEKAKDDRDEEYNIHGKKRKKRERPDDDSEGTKEDDNNWVQCDSCKKWRIIPTKIKISSLPERWYCHLNIYDDTRNSCEAPEQTARTPIVKKKKKGKKNRRQRIEALGAGAVDELKVLSRQNSSQAILMEEKVNEKVKEKARSRSPAPTPQEDIKVPSVKSKVKEVAPKSGGSTPRPPRASPNFATALVEKVKASSVDVEAPPRKKPKSEKKTRRLPDAPLELAEVAPPEAKVKRGRGGRSRREKESSKEQGDPANVSGHGSVSSQTGQEDADNVEWVQCEKCDKWRKLPPHVTAAELPDVWYCTMNTWNPKANTCSAAEDKADGQQDVRVDPSNDSSNKVSYRNLIFGSGRKVNRPLSERTRAAESIFAVTSEDSDYPVVAYANSSVFAPRGSRANIIEDEGNGRSVFDLMNHSNLWAELRSASQPVDPSTVESTGFGKPFLPKYSFETLPVNMRQDMKDMILRTLGSNTFLGEEVLLECQCRQWDNAPSSWAEVRAYCTKDIVIILLCEMVKEGSIQLVQAFGTDWTVKDWNPRYRLASNSRKENSAPPAPKSKCMKISKPWKKQRA